MIELSVENDAVKTIASEIKKATQDAINNAAFDKTCKARILTYSGNNRYQVQLDDGQKYIATSEGMYNINEIVYVTIARNNYNNIFISSGVTHTNESSSWTLENIPLTLT